jgi:Fe-S cluster assembly ATP-binding protein
MTGLVIRDLHVRLRDDGDVEILRGVNLDIIEGEVHALMGPNGSGKSTLSYALLGHPKYEIVEGRIEFNGVDILELEPNERAQLGLFLAFQYPVAIPGVSMANFLRLSINARRKAENPEDKGISIPEFRRLLKGKMDILGMDHSFAGRYLNDGFSGGEKKKAEVLQMAVMEPHIAIMDETDSGLDIDALRTVSEGVDKLRGPNMGILVITHYQRILNYIKPDFVHIMFEGRIVQSGGPDLALELEEKGYEEVRKKYQQIA